MLNTIYLIVGIIVVIGIAAAVFLGGGVSPDFDAILAEGDCEAVGKLTDADMEGATLEQQLGLGLLLGTCMVGG